MLRSALITLMLAGLATVAAADTVYKWVDRGGQIHYTDLPPDQPGAKLLGVFERQMVVGSEGEEGAADTAPEFYDPEPALEEASDRDAATAVQRDVAQAYAEQCKKAQEKYRHYVESRRLFREMPDGSRQYLTDEELTRARVEAKQDVDAYCKQQP